MRREIKTRGICAQQMEYEIVDGCVRNVNFQGGCAGNLVGIAQLVEGMPVAEVIEKLGGINCKGRGTSCPDQLAKALREEGK